MQLPVNRPRVFVSTGFAVALVFCVLYAASFYRLTPSSLLDSAGFSHSHTESAPGAEPEPNPEPAVSVLKHTPVPQGPTNISLTLVLGHLADDNTTAWATSYPGINTAIYVADNLTAPLHLEENKGRESAVYLKYILEHYDTLSDVTVFTHNSEVAWHNNFLLRRNLTVTLDYLRRQFVLDRGYVNTRCDHYPGCPDWVHTDPDPERHAAHRDRFQDLFTSELFHELFPNHTSFPPVLAQPCCSQFAVSRAAILKRPRLTYELLYDYVSKGLFDALTGRVMEYMWQYIFTNRGEVCPSMRSCYCDAYDVCFDDDLLLREHAQIVEMDEAYFPSYGNENATLNLPKLELVDPRLTWGQVQDRRGELEKLIPTMMGIPEG